MVKGTLTNIVSVVKHLGAGAHELHHESHMCFHARHGQRLVLHWVFGSQRVRCLTRHSGGVIALQRIVCTGLISQRFRHNSAFRKPLQQVDRIGHHSHGDSFTAFTKFHRAVDRHIKVFVHLVQIPVVFAFFQALHAHVGHQRGAIIHGDRQRLRAAHAAAPSSHIERPLERSTKVLPRALGKRLVGALQNSLRPNVDPTSRSHLPVHHQPTRAQIIEVFLSRPVRHQVGIGDHHPRRIGVGANHANWLAALHQQRLVHFQFLQALDDCIKALPVTRSLSAASVHHQVLGTFRHFWIQIVHQHAHSGFSGPGLAGALVSARGANDSMCNGGHGGAIVGMKANILTAIARRNSSSGSASNIRPRPSARGAPISSLHKRARLHQLRHLKDVRRR